ncbi:type II toxin-antitoxin system RelE/ParE family toxin [Sulfurovum sp. bin170]|uniref:type II toxin-antitoxin system RelE/ParE family toxin n=1 Tax=Sulfurovum sp. bin170 TaxID=2695268 RepID=UPI0013DEDB3A|nr:type II toxin-antitoxin system RelE/ParE family toxin [Sulfurovum sp. bin170]
MIVEKGDKFDSKLDAVLDYIARDSLNRAIDFSVELEEKLNKLPHMPYKFRRSIYFDDENIRDCIFKGYVIPYLIDGINNKIILLGIVKYREKL